MPLLLGLDFETTGVEPDKCRIVEVGLAVYDASAGKLLDMLDVLVKVEDLLPDEVKTIVDISGLSLEDLSRRGLHPTEALSVLSGYLQAVDYVVAHNGNLFDKPLLAAEFARHRIDPVVRPWIDTTVDLPYPEKIGTRKLVYLAAEHGFVNPFPHRALSDVLTMLRVLGQYPIDSVIASAQQPTLTVQALTPYDQRDLAKEAGFYWKPERRAWLKTVKEGQLEALRQKVKFQFRVL